MIKKTIRKKLLEEKKLRENKLISEQLIKNRLSMIVESPSKFKSLKKEQQQKLFFKVMNEVHELEKNGIITEGLGDILSSLFGQGWSSIAQSFIEPMVESILGWFNIKGSPAKFISSFIASKPQRLSAALSDCRELTKLLVESFSEMLVRNMAETRGMDGVGWGIIRNALGGAIKDAKFMQTLESQMADGVCKLFGSFTNKAENVLNKVQSQPAVAQ